MAVRSSFGSRPITFKKSLRATRTTGWFELPSGAGRPAPVYEYVDTHTHLDAIYARLRRQLDWPFAELARSFPPGFAGCVTLPIGTSFDATMDFIERGGPLVYGAVGLHPHHAKHWDSAVEDRLRPHLQHSRVLALAEAGLDYYHCRAPPDV
jgi:TatD DNase family protein